nr:unnamed protein product [Callosobruchus analis]
MGLAGYLRKFVPEFGSRTACITRLTKQGVPFCWGQDQENARNIGYGAILVQKHGIQPKIVACFSKRTTECEAKYHSYELKTLAIIQALKHFRKFTIVTDCNSIKATATKKIWFLE